MENKICPVPFFKVQIHPFRYVDLSRLVLVPCCGHWVKNPYRDADIIIPEREGKIDLMSAWNSPMMIEFRRSIIDRSFRYCRQDTCPYFYSDRLPWVREEVIDSIKSGEVVLNYLPETIDLCIDLKCNLHCFSCRIERRSIEDRRTYVRMIEFMKIARNIFMNGAGEVFSNQQMIKALREYDPVKYPQLEGFLFITNGTLLNKTMWISLPYSLRERILDINVSVDSFNKDSYEEIRKGASFEVISRNLLFLSMLRKNGELKHSTITCILQQKNMQELYDFVYRSIELGFDTIIINKIENWIHSDYIYNKIKLPEDWKEKYSKEIEKVLDLIKSSKVELVSNVIKI